MNSETYNLPTYLLVAALTGMVGTLPNSIRAADDTPESKSPAPTAQPDDHQYYSQPHIYHPDPGEVVADALIIRPLSLVATVVGTGLFIVTLPFTILGNQVDESAKAFVGVPAYHTFSRCLGCLGYHGYHGYPGYYRYGYPYPYYYGHHGYGYGYHHGHYHYPYYGYHGHHGFHGHHHHDGHHGHHGYHGHH